MYTNICMILQLPPVLLATMCVILVKVRHVPGLLAGTHGILAIAWNTTFISVLVILISMMTVEIPLIRFIKILGTSN